MWRPRRPERPPGLGLPALTRATPKTRPGVPADSLGTPTPRPQGAPRPSPDLRTRSAAAGPLRRTPSSARRWKALRAPSRSGRPVRVSGPCHRPAPCQASARRFLRPGRPGRQSLRSTGCPCQQRSHPRRESCTKGRLGPSGHVAVVRSRGGQAAAAFLGRSVCLLVDGVDCSASSDLRRGARGPDLTQPACTREGEGSSSPCADTGGPCASRPGGEPRRCFRGPRTSAPGLRGFRTAGLQGCGAAGLQGCSRAVPGLALCEKNRASLFWSCPPPPQDTQKTSNFTSRAALETVGKREGSGRQGSGVLGSTFNTHFPLISKLSKN